MARFAREISIFLLASGLGLLGCTKSGGRDTTGPVYDPTGRPYQGPPVNSIYGDPGNMGTHGVGGSNAQNTGPGGASDVGSLGTGSGGGTGQTSYIGNGAGVGGTGGGR